MGKRKAPSVWKFNDDEWKIHIESQKLKDDVLNKFELRNSATIYYENGSFKEETAWDIIVPDNLINKVKKYIKDNS